MTSPASLAATREALRRLEVDRLALGIHEAALPSAPGAETGRGSLAARGGQELLGWAAGLGFDALQLGPGGMTARGNPSPYDGTLFSRDLLSLDVEALTREDRRPALLDRERLDRELAALPASASRRVPHAIAWDLHHRLLDAAWRAAQADGAGRPELCRDVARFTRREADWLVPDALWPELAAVHGSGDWPSWPALDRELWAPATGEAAAARRRRRELARRHATAIARWSLAQLLLAEQWATAHMAARDRGMALLGDAQVGMSAGDAWRLHPLFLAGYRLGAPPSRTNPEGQPWDYPVLDPAQRWEGEAGGRPGPVIRLLERRFGRVFARFDGLRIDHPHGLVCPWVYRADDPDPGRAVRAGARLHAASDLPDHPRLAAFAIARPDQLAHGRDRWADQWVRELDEPQVERYGELIATALDAATRAGLAVADVACEVLSTCPLPLRRVLARHGLGRFRVTQKADLADPADVYRPENAEAADWVMLANHDTPTVWEAIDGWDRGGVLSDRAAHLASRLAGDGREALARRLLAAPRLFAAAMLAEALACPARHVLVYFTDLLGMRQRYNLPGTVSDDNWSLRVPPEYRELTARQGLDLGLACRLALAARGDEDAELAAALGGSSALAAPS